MAIQSGYLSINNNRIYYEEAGSGTPFVMVHAGVADRRMWDDQFAHFANHYRVIRFDMRGYGNTEMVSGEYSDRADLLALMDALGVEKAILMGCSKGGTTIIDFAIEHYQRVAALIAVGSGLSGVDFEGDPPPFWDELEKAEAAGEFDLAAEYDTRIWFDSRHRSPDQVDPAARAKALEMARGGYKQQPGQGQFLPLTPPAAERLHDLLGIPMLVIVGSLDDPNILRIADKLKNEVPGTRKVIMDNTAHFPNLERPEEFNLLVANFLDAVHS